MFAVEAIRLDHDPYKSIKYERCNLIFTHHYYAYEAILFYWHNVHLPKA